MARFNDATGLYKIPNLPAGFVEIRASAPGFAALDARLPVGTNIARELVLQRSEPLVDATHALWGQAFVAGSTTTAYVGVKIEILDGPLAGVFTFTDEFFGEDRFPRPAAGRDTSPCLLRATANSDAQCRGLWEHHPEFLHAVEVVTVVGSGAPRVPRSIRPRPAKAGTA